MEIAYFFMKERKIMSRLKILSNVQTKHLGGITRHVNGLINAIEKNDDFFLYGVEMSRFSATKTKDSQLQNFSLKRINFNEPYQEDFFKNLKSLDDLKTKLKKGIDLYKNLIKEINPNFVLVNGTYWEPWLLITAAKETGCPAIVYYAGSISAEIKKFSAKTQRILLAMEKEFDSSNVVKYIFPSNLIKNRVEKEIFNHPINNFIVIPNGINIHNEKTNLIKTSAVGMVARWTHVKNPNYIFDLIKINKKEGRPLTFNVVTDISENNIKYNKLNAETNLYKPMEYSKLVDFYLLNRVIICPSIFETFGNVPLEAVSLGIPALVSRNMGVADTFKHLGLESLVVDFSNPQDIFNKLLIIQNNWISQDVIKLVRDNYSFDYIYKQYLDHFTTIGDSLIPYKPMSEFIPA